MHDTDATTITSRRANRALVAAGRGRAISSFVEGAFSMYRSCAEAVDLLVDRGVLLDVQVLRGDVRLGLVVVVVGDEVLDGVLREELAELVAELRRERLVVRDQ